MPTERFTGFREIQERLRERVRLTPLARSPETIAAVDVHFRRDSVCFAAAVLTDPECGILDRTVIEHPVDVPYVPGYLSFREMPVCVQALAGLGARPDLILVDGHGTAHPRRFGLACHLGVELDLPTVGVAKSRLVGEGSDPALERGSMAIVSIDGDTVGVSLRTRDGVKPLFVSPGHRINLEESIEWVLRLTRGYRLPEPSRIAHRLARGAANSTDGTPGKILDKTAPSRQDTRQ